MSLTKPIDLVPTRSAAVDWQTAMKRAIRSTATLRSMLGLEGESPGAAADRDAVIDFPTFVPLEFLSRIRPGDPDDPLLRQVLTTDDERVDAAGFVADPVGDEAARVADRLLHKYSGRVLIVTTAACGVHCRYCFRREYPYADAAAASPTAGTAPSPGRWSEVVDYLRLHTEVDEVLLSGGDPLTMVDRRIDELLAAIESVPHVRRIRIHSRMPIVIPQRITDELVDRLVVSRCAIWMVVHCNHAAELDRNVLDATDRLIDRGIPVLNQAVLLRGVNDDPQTLETLCRRLVDHRIVPYYLHQLDRVRGAAHFEVDVQRGRSIMAELTRRLPGYAVPAYVHEIAGEASKTRL